jgi:hypothetical protein
MTIKALYPTVRPTLNLDFAKTKALDPRITFTRASTATFVGSNGLIQTAASGASRFDHNPATGESLGLLVEEARTNLIFQSQDLTTSWTPVGVTVTSNVAVAPDGTTTADKITYANGANYTEIRSNSWTVTAGQVATFSCYLKNAGGTYATLRISADNDRRATFNLATGAVTGVQSGVTAYEMKNVGNGWYRCSVTAAPTTTQYTYSSVFDSFGGVGNGVDGVYVWGAQQELGAFPTSYIPTTTATVTRAADVASMTGTNFSSWYNPNAGSIFAKSVSARAVVNIGGVFSLSNNTLSETIESYFSSEYHLFVNVGGINQVSLDAGTNVTNVPSKVAAGFAANSFAVSLNGGAVSTDSSGTMATVDRLYIASNRDGGTPLNGTIARLAYYPVRLPDAQLQALTAT